MASNKRPEVLTEDSKQIEKVTEKKIEQVETEGITFKPYLEKTKPVHHHVAKLMPAIDIKNKSYKVGGYIPFEQEHSHVWHSISSHSGSEKEYCEPVLGHRHKITMTKLKDGSFKLECGPAVVESNMIAGNDKRVKAYSRKRIRPAQKDENGDIQVPAQFDEHTHDIKYLKSEILNINV